MAQVPDWIGASHADVGQIGAETEIAKHDRVIAQIILGHRSALTPTPVDIRTRFLRANLLRVAFHAAVRAIDFRAELSHPRTRDGVLFAGASAYFLLLLTDLEVRRDDQAPKRGRHRQKDPEE